jgi:ribosomal protein L11 methyltransferase
VSEAGSDTTPWLQLTLEPGQIATEQLEDALLVAGALAVTLEDAGAHPILEPGPGQTPLWPATRVTGLFDARTTDICSVQAQLLDELNLDALPAHHLSPLEERNWTRAWMDGYHPMRFGDRLWVCPRHLDPPPGNAVSVLMDPGLAFGTGTHPTTALCLRWLEQADLIDKQILDYGCGSGILAIAAIKLGARRAWAVDIDPQALHATVDNAQTNHVADRISVFEPGELPSGQVDVVVANILAGPLLALAPSLASRLRPGGELAISGLLARHTTELEACYQQWFDLEPALIQEDWVLLHGQRRSGQI